MARAADVAKYGADAVARIAALNRADVALHEHAASLFDARWESMLAALPDAERGLRFVAKGNGARARGGGSSQVTYALQ